MKKQDFKIRIESKICSKIEFFGRFLFSVNRFISLSQNRISIFVSFWRTNIVRNQSFVFESDNYASHVVAASSVAFLRILKMKKRTQKILKYLKMSQKIMKCREVFIFCDIFDITRHLRHYEISKI